MKTEKGKLNRIWHFAIIYISAPILLIPILFFVFTPGAFAELTLIEKIGVGFIEAIGLGLMILFYRLSKGEQNNRLKGK